MNPTALKREISLLGAVMYGVGIIIGAGVYVLIGRASGYAGNSVWISFILAAVVASFTAFSYAELTSMFPASGAEYVYVEKAFKHNLLSFTIGWLVLVSGIISASTVALGFGGYLKSYVAVPEVFSAVVLIVLLSLINFWGIKQSIKLNTALAFAEILGLVIVILLGANYFGKVDYFESPSGGSGIVAAAALIFFAFIGFESLSKIGEETKDPQRTIPKALILSLLISSILYAAVAISAVSVVPYEQLASSASPLADVALRAQGSEAFLTLSIIAMFATANTVLIMLIATSRIAYGMAKEASLPEALAKIHRTRGTPWGAVFVTMALSAVFVLLGDVGLVASVTNFMIFLVYLVVNLALISLRLKGATGTGGFRSPFNVSKVPIFAVLGAVSSIAMLFQFNATIVLISVVATVLGIPIYRFAGRRGSRGRVAN